MNNFGLSFWLLILSTLLTVVMFVYISCQKDRKQLHNVFCLNLFCSLIISVGVLCQAVCNYFFSIPSIWFENIIYIGTCFLPLTVFFTSLIFINTKMRNDYMKHLHVYISHFALFNIYFEFLFQLYTEIFLHKM